LGGTQPGKAGAPKRAAEGPKQIGRHRIRFRQKNFSVANTNKCHILPGPPGGKRDQSQGTQNRPPGRMNLCDAEKA